MDLDKTISKNDAIKLESVITSSVIPAEDKKWWLSRVNSLNIRQAKQLWKILHTTDTSVLDDIIKEEEDYQIHLKAELEDVVRDGLSAIYKTAEEEDNKVEQIELHNLLESEGIQ